MSADGDRPQSPDEPGPSAEQMTQWLAHFIEPGQVVEMRAPRGGKPGPRGRGTVVKFFDGDHLKEVVREARKLSGQVPAIYFTLNPVSPSPKRERRSANAGDILRRRLLLIDFDPIRPKPSEKASSTDDEKAAAHTVALIVRDFLQRRGWPEPILADSGNGWHLLYRIDLPNNEASTELVKAILKGLSYRFDDAAVKIDTSTFDPPRICKLYGTKACKGTATADRPHRFSRMVSIPTEFTIVGPELLKALAEETAPPEPTTAAPIPPSKPTGKGRRKAGDGTTIPPLAIRIDRGRKLLETCEPAVSGEGGHNRTFKVACHLGPGLDLPPDVALDLLRKHYNPKCQPPWTDDELRHKVDDAYRVEMRRGFLLGLPVAGANGQAPIGHDGAAVPPPPGTSQPHEPGDDGAPTILVTTREHRVIDQAIASLEGEGVIYQRANTLVTVLRDSAGPKGVLRPAGSPRIILLPMPRLRELLTKTARWARTRKTRDGDEETIPVHPPDWAVAGVASRGEWPGIRPIEAVVEAPILRHDGTVLDTPGYDQSTGILYEPNTRYPAIPPRPTHADARKAAGVLSDLVCDFPFAGVADRAAWLAALLTPLARFAIAGPCPLFLIDANVRGVGKSKLTDIIAIIATGREMPRTSYPDGDEEMRKRITSIALAGDRLMLLDNIDTAFGGSSLDAALTAMTWRDRLLSRSEMTAELPLFTVWYGTGNNVTLRGDLIRRVVPSRIESMEERPEERADFAVKDLIAHVHQERPKLLAAALTLLRAHAVAGRPGGDLPPLGSFEAWSAVVRSAVHWALGIDPCRTREGLRASDLDAGARAALVEAWTTLPDARDKGVTAAEALKRVQEDPNRYADLREALMYFSRKGDLPSVRALGQRLGSMRDRVINGMVLRSTQNTHNHKLYWRVEYVANPES